MTPKRSFSLSYFPSPPFSLLLLLVALSPSPPPCSSYPLANGHASVYVLHVYMCARERASPHPCDLRFLRRFPTLNSEHAGLLSAAARHFAPRSVSRDTRVRTALSLARPNIVSARRRSIVTSRESKFRRERVIVSRFARGSRDFFATRTDAVRAIRRTRKLSLRVSSTSIRESVAFRWTGWGTNVRR